MRNFIAKLKLKTLGTMIIGAALLIVCLAVIWSIQNFDVLVKAYKYPEAVRSMDVSIQIVTPVVKK